VNQRAQTDREEAANALSHGIGFFLAAVSLPVLQAFTARQGNDTAMLGAVVFSATMMLLYFASAVYHALPPGRWKGVFRRLDHAAIFIFIAGSYTPFALGPLQGSVGWLLFLTVWSLAALGVAAKAAGRLRQPLWSTLLYVAMGWLGLAALEPLLERMGHEGMLLLLAGGVAYTVGALFFLIDHRLRYAHFIWHLFVIAGSSLHFVAALRYAV
jgi:hemolysin III